MNDENEADTSTEDEQRIDYADPTPPAKLHETIAAEAPELWAKNEQLFVWMVTHSENGLLQTVPGGGKSYVKETIVPQLAHQTDRTFVLATTEYRNRQETYEKVLETLINRSLYEEVTVTYVPSPRETYDNIPQVESEGSKRRVTTPSDETPVCQTFTTDDDGNYTYGAADNIDRLVSRGSTTGAVHKAVTSEWEENSTHDKGGSDGFPLPCQNIGVKRDHDPTDPEKEPACRHRRMMQRAMDQIERGKSDIIICGASLLYISDVVQDATVVVDEDVAGELVTTHQSGYYQGAVDNFLSGIDDAPDTLNGADRRSEGDRKDIVESIRETHAPRSQLGDEDERDPLINGNAPLQSNSYPYDRAEAPLYALAALAGTETAETGHIVFDGDLPYSVAIDMKSEAGGSSHERAAIVRSPQALSEAEQVIALDATGSQDWWELVMGVNFKPMSPTPRDKQADVVSEAFGINFYQSTENMVPINSPENLDPREFLGILQAITDHHEADEVSVVTSKTMREKVLESEYEDQVMELAYEGTILHFGALRSDRTFEQSTLHAVIGAPHPGDAAVRQRMSLLGHDDEIVQHDSSLSGEDRYRGAARDVLENIVHAEVYQAARRAARDLAKDESASVYLHTRMFDDDLIDIDQKYTVDILGKGEKRAGATEAIIDELGDAESWIKTKEVKKRVNRELDGSLSDNRILEKLNEMKEVGTVKQRPWTQSYEWKMDGPVRHATLKPARDR